MGDGDDYSATTQAQQRAELPYQVATGEQIDDHTLSAGITIRPGSGVESVRVRVPGMDEFETSPGQLREWLQQHNFIRTPQEWTVLDQMVQDAIGRGHISPENQPAGGEYNWDTYTPSSNATETDLEHLNEAQTADWNRMLDAWHQFEQQVNDLRSIATGDAESIIRQVGHTITALDMIASNGWVGSYAAELGAWEGLSADAVSVDSLHSAATSVVDAGDILLRQWHAAIDAGNYESAHLTDSERAFIAACTQARTALHQ